MIDCILFDVDRCGYISCLCVCVHVCVCVYTHTCMYDNFSMVSEWLGCKQNDRLAMTRWPLFCRFVCV